jgi:hypothetical protein
MNNAEPTVQPRRIISIEVNEATMPKVGQRIVLVRDVHSEVGDDSLDFGKGMLATVTEIHKPPDGIGGFIGITFDEKQPTSELQEELDAFRFLTTQEEQPPRYYFYFDTIQEEATNGLILGGLLDFHMRCAYTN